MTYPRKPGVGWGGEHDVGDFYRYSRPTNKPTNNPPQKTETEAEMLKPPPVTHCALCGNDSDALYEHATPEWQRRNEQIRQILHERDRQDAKWGEQNHSPEVWLAILGEEFGEACQAALGSPTSDFRKEIVQVAAVAVAMLEWMNRTGYGR